MINVHCHLELTNLHEKLPKNKPFYEWLSALRKEVETWTIEDYKKSYLKGLELSAKSGTKIIYDVGNQLAEPLQEPSKPTIASPCSPSCGHPFGLGELQRTIFGLSVFPMHEVIKQPLPPVCVPHSIYATPAELVRSSIKECRKVGVPWSIHLAEFDDSDRFCDFLVIFKDEPELVKHGFIVHGNFLKESDLDFMAKNNIALVHCPQSHEWFGHRDPDFEMWKKSGVDICIATDSLASASSLDLMEQIKTLFRRYPKAFTREEAFAMVTSVPAKYF